MTGVHYASVSTTLANNFNAVAILITFSALSGRQKTAQLTKLITTASSDQINVLGETTFCLSRGQ